MKRILLPGLMILALGIGTAFAAPGGANANPAANVGQTGASGGTKTVTATKTSSSKKKSKKKHHKKKHHKSNKKG